MATEVFAPAKVNLTLHVTGRRADGYHLIDSLVVFADVGDALSIRPAGTLRLTIDGPEAAGLSAGDDNLVLRAARSLSADRGADIRLTKTLPVASGIGGGSADAAAALRGLATLWRLPAPADPARLLRLGADVPMCLASRAARAQGLGEVLTPLPDLPPLPAVLVNPRLPVATADVFRALAVRDNPPMPEALPGFPDVPALAAWLAHQRNDLQGAATRLQPAIGSILAEIGAAQGCLLARMSGSGATCFGLFADTASAGRAAAAIAGTHPGWWVRATRLGDQLTRATT